MKAILDTKYNSYVIGWGPSGVDAGPAPRDVGLERVRYDGSKLVDIGPLRQFYVVEEGANTFSLHARPVEGSQLVSMTYADRKKLVNDNGTIRVKTPAEIADEIRTATIKRIEHKARAALEKQMGIMIRQFLFTHKLLYALIWALRTENPQGLAFVDSYLAEMATIFDLTDPVFKDDLISEYLTFKNVIGDYLDDLSSVP